MTLIITAMAAIIATIAWYIQLPKNKYRFGVLALIYWAAALMWCVDGIFSLTEGEGFIEITNGAIMLNDALLGIVIVVAGLVVWGIYLLVRRLSNRTHTNMCESK